jgi:hypothetical protein
LATKRPRHLHTICGDTRRLAATAALLRPLAHSNTIRARKASACAVFARRVQRSSAARSLGATTNLAFGRPRSMLLLPGSRDVRNMKLIHIISRTGH